MSDSPLIIWRIVSNAARMVARRWPCGSGGVTTPPMPLSRIPPAPSRPSHSASTVWKAPSGAGLKMSSNAVGPPRGLGALGQSAHWELSPNSFSHVSSYFLSRNLLNFFPDDGVPKSSKFDVL